MRLFLCLFPLIFINAMRGFGAPVVETEVCVYGGTSGGVIAAVQAARHGKSAALAVFGNHVGGLTSGGLGQTDIGSNGNGYIQGVAREFYDRIATRYSVAGPKFTFEPKVAESVFDEMLTQAGVLRRNGQRLASVQKNGQRIAQITMDDGTVYRARMFIDASYEGDLMAMAGVSWTIGREAVATYGETLNGIRASTPAHQFTVNVDPYVTPGNPVSGLLPFIQPGDGGTPGDGDSRVQAYNYRLCLTNSAANRVAIAAPAGYNEARYELLGRLIDARLAAGNTLTLGSFMNIGSMPNSKTDINNNGAFSTDFIGMSDSYPTASYAQRTDIAQQHRDYIQGFLYYLGHSTRVPAAVRSTMLSYGWCADEFTDRGGWGELYVREARRMVSDYVMLQQNCQSSRVAADSIGLGAYTMDSHNCQRVVQGGVVKNEGDAQAGIPAPYGIAYRSIVPRVGECENLLVPWALSASHIAFGSIRMEPVFMILGHSAATAASFAIDDEVAVQQVSYAKLALGLLADKQLLNTTSSGASGIIVDNADPTGVTLTGAWTTSTSTSGYWGSNYFHDANVDKGTKSVRFTPNLSAAGDYEVYLRWTTDPNRAIAVPVDVVSATGTSSFIVNQQANGGDWVKLTTSTFNAGSSGSLLVRTNGTLIDSTHGFVIADAARWVPLNGALPAVQMVASDAITREGASDAARVMLVRAAGDAANTLTVSYSLSGTATGGDFAALPGTATFAAGATTTLILVQAIGDAASEGTETLTISLQAGASYTVGALGSATVRLLDRPIDDWRHTHFTGAELVIPQVSGDTADPDQDGLSNIEEYARGLNPRLSSTATFSPQIVGPEFVLTYTRARVATDVSIAVEGSYDLTTWGTSGVTEVSRIDEGALERVTARLAPSAATPGRGFLRLRISR